jgi:hypothetical protein
MSKRSHGYFAFSKRRITIAPGSAMMGTIRAVAPGCHSSTGPVERSEVMEFAFSGGRSGSGPATWGQSGKWNVVRGLGTDAARYNVTGGSPVPTPVPVERIAEVVRDLVLLHDSLRTRLRTGDDGRLAQVVYPSGAVPVVSRSCATEGMPV